MSRSRAVFATIVLALLALVNVPLPAQATLASRRAATAAEREQINVVIVDLAWTLHTTGPTGFGQPTMRRHLAGLRSETSGT